MSEPYQPGYSGVLVPRDWDFAQVLDQVLGQDPSVRTSQELHDLALERWLQRVLQMGGKVIPVVMASPMNAYSRFYDQYRTCGSAAPPQDYRPPMPFISVQSRPPQPRGGRNSFPMRRLDFVDDTESEDRKTAQYRAIHTRYPKPLTYSYAITIWALYRSHLQLLHQRLEESFMDDLAYLRVRQPWKLHGVEEGVLTAMRRTRVDETSDLDRGAEERVLRFVMEVEVEGWMFFDLQLAPVVHSTTIEVRAKGPGQADGQSELVSKVHTALTPVAKASLDEVGDSEEPFTDGVG